MVLACSPQMRQYLDYMDKASKELHAFAAKAREQNLDPEPYVDIPLATTVAQKVEALIASIAPQIRNSGLSQAIEEVEKKYSGGDWRVALEISKSVAQQKFCKFTDLRECVEIGIRTGFAYATLGSVSAPLEGFVELKLKKRIVDDKEYMAMYFSGPIRGAGGTAIAICILIGEYLRKAFNISEYDITPEEVKRYQVELDDYLSKVAHRQYKPSAEEIEMLVRNMKMEITGDPTESFEVSQCKRLPRVETDNIRGGMALVMTEGPPLKAEKIWKQLQKWGKDFGFEDWMVWLKTFIDLKAKLHSAKEGEISKINPNDSYLSDIVAGRPVLGYPMRTGGFRLRYGRTRLTSMAATAIHPATMAVLNDYIAIGTQVKTERPGKATVCTPCDSIEGPIVRLEDGSVLLLNSYQEARSVRQKISEVLYVGDMLISYGDFSEGGQRLAPAGYVEEWWELEAEQATGQKAPILQNAKAAIEFAQQTKTPLHPKYNYFWREISGQQFALLKNWLQKLEQNQLPLEPMPKRVLELIGCPHKVSNNTVMFDENEAYVLDFLLKNKPDVDGKTGLDCLNKISPVLIRDKSGTFIGTRMGRPEKAKLRKLKGSPAVLFPVGREGGRFRSLNEAANKKEILVDAPIFSCESCGTTSMYSTCENCGKKTEMWRYCPLCKKKTKKAKCHIDTVGYERRKVDVTHFIKKALEKLSLSDLPPLVKGVKGTWNKDRVVEHLEKGILRAKNHVTVNKDGTIRYDMTQLPCTHFTPIEIGTSIEKLKQLGYETDINNTPITNENQIVELKPQDVILPSSPKSPDETADVVLIRACHFIDDLLEQFYKLPRFYNVRTKNDLIGQLVIGLAPHTSCGVAARIVGFAETQGIYAHPFMHAAMRRNCDGDETCVLLMLDAFLNFSRNFLPDRRGGRNMDAPLVLLTILMPQEVDTEAHNVDTPFHYPLDLYVASQEAKFAWEVKVQQVKDRLGTELQYEKFGYTHPVSSMSEGVQCSAYKTIPTMLEKLAGQLDIAGKLRAVDMAKVAELVVDKHFLRDIKGNLRGFTTQTFRCIACNAKYRRTPLKGVCTSCGGRLVFTISEGTIRKYLEAAIKLANLPNMPAYMQQTLEILKRRIDYIFGKEATKQIELKSWFNNP